MLKKPPITEHSTTIHEKGDILTYIHLPKTAPFQSCSHWGGWKVGRQLPAVGFSVAPWVLKMSSWTFTMNAFATTHVHLGGQLSTHLIPSQKKIGATRMLHHVDHDLLVENQPRKLCKVMNSLSNTSTDLKSFSISCQALLAECWNSHP